MSSAVERVEDRLADFTRDKRVVLLSFMALFIGALSAVVAKALVWQAFVAGRDRPSDVRNDFRR